MNKALNKYVNEIIAIGIANKLDWNKGINMFLSNVKAQSNIYKGADTLDWSAIAKDLGTISDVAEADMINTFIADYHKNHSEIIALRREGKYNEVRKLMENT